MLSRLPANPSRDVLSVPGITAAVITYNGRSVLPECLESLLRQTVAPVRILVVDNASTDGTPAWVREHYPQVEVVDYPVNKGPNPARNEAIRQSATDLVLLIDDDAVLHERCIEELVAAWQRFPDAAAWCPRIMYHDRQDRIQFEGTSMHYLTEAILLNPDAEVSAGITDISPIQVAGGVAYLLSRSKALAVGLFDEDYFFGRTDAEFGFRLTLAGYDLYTLPGAVCYHRVKKRGTTKVYFQMRNRWHLLLTCYAWRTIALISPALLVYELCLFIFLLLKGSAVEYLRANVRVLLELPHILRKRRRVQSLKKRPDSQLLHAAPMNMRADLLDSSLAATAKRVLDAFFILYWRVVCRFV